MPEDIPGIFQRFTMWEKERVYAGRIQLMSLGILTMSYTPRPRLPYTKAQNMEY
jgi:hypothetical protein